MGDLYRILQVDPAADPEIIEAAWRRLARIYHPDGERPDAERMRDINVAHDILKDPVKRAEYDRTRSSAAADTTQRDPTAKPPPPPPPWGPPGPRCWRHPDVDAVTSCLACRAYLCAACAAHWPAPLCDSCVRDEAVRRQRQLIWTAIALAAWIAVAAVELDALLKYRLGGSSAVGLLALAFYLGPGVVGTADLAWLAFSRLPLQSVRALGAVSWVIMLFLCPISLLAGCVMVFVRAGLATRDFVHGRRLRRAADRFLAR